MLIVFHSHFNLDKMDIKMKIMNIDLDYMEKESQEGNGWGRGNYLGVPK